MIFHNKLYNLYKLRINMYKLLKLLNCHLVFPDPLGLEVSEHWPHSPIGSQYLPGRQQQWAPGHVDSQVTTVSLWDSSSAGHDADVAMN